MPSQRHSGMNRDDKKWTEDHCRSASESGASQRKIHVEV
jgi:hypothetical protein